MIPANAKERFSDRVDDYKKYRPRYPEQVVDILKEICSLNDRSVLADIGSGTGIMTELLLPRCRQIFAVEPNLNMRQSAEELLSSRKNFISVNGSAEATTLPDHSIDIVVAAQAFHWFDPQPTRKEFQRILKPHGWLVLIWNKRDSESDAFHQEYETLLKTAIPDYSQVHHRRVDTKALESFFKHRNFLTRTLSNHQDLNWQALQGRTLSSSYVPQKGQPNHDVLMEKLEKLFQKYQHGDLIQIKYITEIYLGQF